MLSLAFSPCPKDTFIFHALTQGLVSQDDIQFDAPYLADVETLNKWALDGKFDVTKLSFHALGHVLDRYVLLDSGSALGRGCGPLLVAKQGRKIDLNETTIAVPGRFTTAAMLLQLYAPHPVNTKIMVFDQIMNAIAEDKVDGGVIIHESRFTYKDHGLDCIQDLGQWWEETTGNPIPLGGIAAKRSLGQERIARINRLIKDSVQFGFNNPNVSQDYIKQHAQEMDSNIITSHINLYVNDFSLSLGPEGHKAVDHFLALGRQKGLFKR